MILAAYHHANILASQVFSEVKIVENNILQAIMTHTSQFETEPNNATPPPQAQSVKSTTLDAAQLEMLRFIKELQRDTKEIKSGESTSNFTPKISEKEKGV